jgi:hypothetical protein
MNRSTVDKHPRVECRCRFSFGVQWVNHMEREAFSKVMQDVLDSLPEEFRSRIRNVAVLVVDFPPGQPTSSHPKKLLLGLFHGVPMTKESVFNLPTGRTTLVSTRRTCKWCVQPRLSSESKSGSRLFMSSGITSAWTRSNRRLSSSALCWDEVDPYVEDCRGLQTQCSHSSRNKLQGGHLGKAGCSNLMCLLR